MRLRDAAEVAGSNPDIDFLQRWWVRDEPVNTASALTRLQLGLCLRLPHLRCCMQKSHFAERVNSF